MKVSISKSVGRAFEVLEAFRELRKPASATDIRRRLKYPHSSMVAVLHNLVAIGYLSYDAEKRHYFPTYKLYRLGSWVQSALMESSSLHDLAAAIAIETGETTAITSRTFIFLNIVHVVTGARPGSAQVPCGIGAPLFKSSPGLVVLGQMTGQEIDRTVRYTNRWSQKTKADFFCDGASVAADIEQIRSDGYAAGYNRFLPGIGAIAYPAPAMFNGAPLAIAVTGPTERIRTQSATIHRIMKACLEMHGHGVRDIPTGWSGRSGNEDWGGAAPRENAGADNLQPRSTRTA